MVDQTVVAPVQEGRLRDLGWPYGLRAVVLLGYLAFALAALLVVSSTAVRRAATLGAGGSLPVGLPEPAVWMLATLFSFGLSLLLVAGLHGPWWLRLLAVLVVLAALGAWALRTPGTSGSVVWTVLALLLLVGVVVLAAVRARRPFAWWELAVAWGLVGTGVVVGLVENRYSVRFGTDQAPVLLQYLASSLGFLVLPTAMVAGASVAEVCVRLTVAATEQAQRLARHWVPYAVLGVVLGVRGVQVGLQLAGLDPVVQGWDVVVASLVLVGLLAGVGTALLALARRRGARPDVDGLGDELTAVALPVGAALILVNLPVQLAAGVVPLLSTLDTSGTLTGTDVDVGALVGRLVDPIRALVGVVVVGLAFRAARRGRATRALVLGTVGVMLVMLARSLVQGAQTRAGVDPDVLNLVATAVVVVGVVAALLRRRLTRSRALALAGALTLCALFSGRDFISDPVGAVLGFSGAALVLFGLTWDLFTGSAWANGESRRFVRPTRVLLVLSGSVVTMSVLAFAALVRDGSTTIYLDPYAAFGDLIFGTALLAAAVVAVLAPSVQAPGAPASTSGSSGSSTSQPDPV
ncbi:hypothetical protein SAMN05421756_10561 [Microlunatus flavus]|uniref:Uncharacterized protein n=1 Tax=Microlunatus flavus TaxID=1036181 RepID=A0A1H9I370_9ACTN|nr:hypothetical protein SAMN05421756_10561 [Microlunatus flavus]